MYVIKADNISLPIDKAIKKDGVWIGEYSGKTLTEIKEKYPTAKVVKK